MIIVVSEDILTNGGQKVVGMFLNFDAAHDTGFSVWYCQIC